MAVILTNTDNITDADDPALQLNGAASVTTAVVGGTAYLFAAGMEDDGVSVFAVGTDGSLTLVDSVRDAENAVLELDFVRSVTTAVVGNTTYLFAAGADDSGVSVFAVGADGSLSNVWNVSDDLTLKLAGVVSLTTAVVGGTTYLFAGSVADSGVSVFAVGSDGSLTNVWNVSDDPTLKLAGANSVTAVIGGTTYLFAAGFLDDGVSVFRVNADGSLFNVTNVSDDPTLELDGVTGVTTAVMGGFTYLFAAGQDDDGISVFRVDSNGLLANVANVSDDATLELDGASGVTIAVVEGLTYLFTTAQIDNGVSVFRVENNGSLTNVANVNDDAMLELDVAFPVTTAVVGDKTYAFVAGFADDGLSVFRVEDNSGDDTYVVDDLSDIADETGGGGIDTVLSSITLSLSDAALVHGAVENLTLTGSAAVNGAGNDLANVITGNGASNILAGGAGADSFVFNTALNKTTNVDTVADFSHTDDTILLDNAIFTKLKKDGELKKKYFEVGKQADDKDDYIVYNKRTGVLSYDANGDKKGGAVLFAVLEGSPDDISKADFLVI